MASFRSAIAGLALAAALPQSRRFWQPATLAVGSAYAACMILFVIGNKLTTAANTIFLQSTAPMYLLLLGPWLLGERVRRSDIAFAATLACGLGLFFVGIDDARATAPDPARGNVLAAVSGFAWSLTLLGLRWLGRAEAASSTHRAGAAVIAGNVIACLVSLPFALPLASSRPVDWLGVVYLGVFQIGLAYLCLIRGVRGVPALEVSLLLQLEPVLNSFWAWLVHGERPGPWSLAGCSVILLATLTKSLDRGVERRG